MPAGRQRFSTGNGLPGGIPGGHTQSANNDTGQPPNRQSIGHRVCEKHSYTQLSIVNINNAYPLSTGISVPRSIRLIHRKGMCERPDAPPTIYKGRTRFPANYYNQKRDLRHGSQGSITINNPIMEE